MYSATSSPSFLFLPSKTPSILHRSNNSIFNPPSPLFCYIRPTISRRHLSVCLAERDFELSWVSPIANPAGDCGGWAIVEYPVVQHKKRAFPTCLIMGIGTSLAVLVAVIANFSLSRKGFEIQFAAPLQVLHRMLSPLKTQDDQNKAAEPDESSQNNLSETNQEVVPVAMTETVTYAIDKPVRVIIPVAVDSTQEEALSSLKKLKIIEDDVEANGLCTRREYARWLVKLNSCLERNPKSKILPMVSLSESVVPAFDDISFDDPDFRSIQALAEAGVIPSKLSWKRSPNSGWPNSGWPEDQGNIKFFADRFIARQDLIDWRAQFEYEFSPRVLDQVSSKILSFMDVKEISSYMSPVLYVDMLAGDRSILRKVFGQSKRFQPNKPSTKAQAAVALMSGRMAEAISSELSRIDAENSARQAEAEEIRSELLSRGDIQRFWSKKLDEEKELGSDVEKLYFNAVKKLEEEKINQEKIYAEHLKEKAATDCQRQLLLSLKKEVDEMSEKLASERVRYLDEKNIVEQLLIDVETKHEEMLDRKSALEAEKEAIQILRSWVEDEARKSHARAAVLEEVGRRWRWDSRA